MEPLDYRVKSGNAMRPLYHPFLKEIRGDNPHDNKTGTVHSQMAKSTTADLMKQRNLLVESVSKILRCLRGLRAPFWK